MVSLPWYAWYDNDGQRYDGTYKRGGQHRYTTDEPAVPTQCLRALSSHG